MATLTINAEVTAGPYVNLFVDGMLKDRCGPYVSYEAARDAAADLVAQCERALDSVWAEWDGKGPFRTDDKS